jgi:hypothetical protein
MGSLLMGMSPFFVSSHEITTKPLMTLSVLVPLADIGNWIYLVGRAFVKFTSA